MILTILRQWRAFLSPTLLLTGTISNLTNLSTLSLTINTGISSSFSLVPTISNYLHSLNPPWWSFIWIIHLPHKASHLIKKNGNMLLMSSPWPKLFIWPKWDKKIILTSNRLRPYTTTTTTTTFPGDSYLIKYFKIFETHFFFYPPLLSSPSNYWLFPFLIYLRLRVAYKKWWKFHLASSNYQGTIVNKLLSNPFILPSSLLSSPFRNNVFPV